MHERDELMILYKTTKGQRQTMYIGTLKDEKIWTGIWECADKQTKVDRGSKIAKLLSTIMTIVMEHNEKPLWRMMIRWVVMFHERSNSVQWCHHASDVYVVQCDDAHPILVLWQHCGNPTTCCCSPQNSHVNQYVYSVL